MRGKERGIKTFARKRRAQITTGNAHVFIGSAAGVDLVHHAGIGIGGGYHHLFGTGRVMIGGEYAHRTAARQNGHHRRIGHEASAHQNAGFAKQHAIARRSADQNRVAQRFLHGHRQQFFTV